MDQAPGLLALVEIHAGFAGVGQKSAEFQAPSVTTVMSSTAPLKTSLLTRPGKMFCPSGGQVR